MLLYFTESMRKYIKKTCLDWKTSLTSKFTNENRRHYINDVVAGVTMGLVRLPLSMAHGLLAELPIEYGIYTDLFGCLFYTVFTSTRHNSGGSTAFLLMILGMTMTDFYSKQGVLLEEVSLTEKLCFASAITLYSGILQCVGCFLRFRYINFSNKADR